MFKEVFDDMTINETSYGELIYKDKSATILKNFTNKPSFGASKIIAEQVKRIRKKIEEEIKNLLNRKN